MKPHMSRARVARARASGSQILAPHASSSCCGVNSRPAFTAATCTQITSVSACHATPGLELTEHGFKARNGALHIEPQNAFFMMLHVALHEGHAAAST